MLILVASCYIGRRHANDRLPPKWEIMHRQDTRAIDRIG